MKVPTRKPQQRLIRTSRLNMACVLWVAEGAMDITADSDRRSFVDRLAPSPALPPVLLIHPNRTSNRVWDHVVAQSHLRHDFIAPALRGHGDSDWPSDGYRLEDHRDDLIALIDTLAIGPAILVGQATEAELMRDLVDEIRYPGPVLVFGGAESTVLPIAMFDKVASRLPDAQLTALPDADHRLCQDNPAGFAVLMDRFVTGLSG